MNNNIHDQPLKERASTLKFHGLVSHWDDLTDEDNWVARLFLIEHPSNG